MAGGNGVSNGAYGAQQAQQIQPMQPGPGASVPPGMADTPLISIAPVSLSLAQLRWVVGGVIGAIWSAYVGGWLFLPAKDADLQSLRGSFEIVQAEQKQARDALVRLTTAVDNLSGIVDRLGSAPQQIQRMVSPRAATRKILPR